MNSVNFLDLARQGKNQWWRYLIGILSILTIWLLSSTIVVAIAFMYWMASAGLSADTAIHGAQKFDVWLQTPDTMVYIFLNLPFVFPLLTIFVLTKWFHQRPIGTLISARRSPNLKRIFAGAWVWGLLFILTEVLLYLMHPQAYKFTFEPLSWLILASVAFVLTPLQTSAEEFFFRSYLLQGMGLLVRNRVVLAVLNGILFTIPHLSNPEIARNPGLIALNYFGMGIFLAYITLRDQSLDLALGAHAANNLCSFLLVNTADSVIPTNALVTVSQPEHPAISLLILAIMVGIFNFYFFGRQTHQVTE
jgi:uncharacterized protein